MESMQPSKVVGHYRGSGTSDNGWITKVAALPVGEDPSQSYVLICGNCHMHNGTYAITERSWSKLDVLSGMFQTIHVKNFECDMLYCS
jgi:hypothetical protein